MLCQPGQNVTSASNPVTLDHSQAKCSLYGRLSLTIALPPLTFPSSAVYQFHPHSIFYTADQDIE